MNILGMLKNIRSTYASIVKIKKMGANTDNLMAELELILDEWKDKAKSLNISNNYVYNPSDMNPKFFILSGMEWIPVFEGKENQQGGLIWKVQYDDNDMNTGRSRIGKWSYCKANGNVYIELTLEGLSKIPLHCI